jgi:TatD DNase family protein
MKTMTITDTHTHLYSEEFDQDRDEMMQELFRMVSLGFYSCNRLYIYRGHVRLRNNYPMFFLMMGLHLPM